MLKPVFFLLRPILWILQDTIARILLAFIAIILILGAIFPGAVHFYPVWKSIVSDQPIAPLGVVEDSLHTEIIHPKRLIPGRSYRLRVEISPAKPITSPQSVELKIWEDDPHIFF